MTHSLPVRYQRSAYLAKYEHGSATDKTPSRDDAVTGVFFLLHTEVSAVMLHKHVILNKCAGITQKLHSFSCG